MSNNLKHSPIEISFNIIFDKKINLNKPNPTLHWRVGTFDSQWYPEKLCLIKYALDIHAFLFENRFFYLWFLFSSDLRISYFRKNKEINRIKHFCQLKKTTLSYHIIDQINVLREPLWIGFLNGGSHSWTYAYAYAIYIFTLFVCLSVCPICIQ